MLRYWYTDAEKDAYQWREDYIIYIWKIILKINFGSSKIYKTFKRSIEYFKLRAFKKEEFEMRMINDNIVTVENIRVSQNSCVYHVWLCFNNSI